MLAGKKAMASRVTGLDQLGPVQPPA